jgi:hypothetical protein
MPKKEIERGAMTLSFALDVIAHLRRLRKKIKVSRYVEDLIRKDTGIETPKKDTADADHLG